jgi:endogenous inhibitor of DNA gyrase (YacG/DUF329 family)
MPSYYFYHCSNSECDFEAYRYRNLRVCPQCRSPVVRESPPDFRVACCKCGTQVGLEMFAHRNKAEQMVGWLFACRKCARIITAHGIVIDVEPATNPTLRQAEEAR